MEKERKERAVRQKASKLLLLLLFMLTACDNTLFHKFVSLESGVWNSTDTLAYCFEGVPARRGEGCYSIRMEVRTTADYSYRNVVMRVEAFALGDTLPQVADTLMCEVYDNSGRRNGSTAGILYQTESETTALPSLIGDTLLFKVTHIMADSALNGISDVGLKLMINRE